MTSCSSGSEQHARRVRHVACYSAIADCGSLLEMLAVQVEVMSASPTEAVVARQCFDSDLRSAPNPIQPVSFENSLRQSRHRLISAPRPEEL